MSGRIPRTWRSTEPQSWYSVRPLQLDDASADGNGDGFGTISRPHFFHDVLHVDFDRIPGNEQQAGDVPVPIPAGDVAKDVDLALGQRVFADVFGQLRRNFGWD